MLKCFVDEIDVQKPYIFLITL